MSYKEKGLEMFSRYQQAFIIDAVAVGVCLKLQPGVKVSLIVAVCICLLGIVLYSVNKLFGFFTISLAIASAIAALYQHFEIGFAIGEGEGKLTIVALITLLVIIQLLYVLMKNLIFESSLKKTGIGLAFVFSVAVIALAYFLRDKMPLFYSELPYIAIIFMLIFTSSVLSVIFIKENWTIYRLLMVSYVMIFMLVFALVITIMLEDDTVLDALVPDGWGSSKKKNKVV